MKGFIQYQLEVAICMMALTLLYLLLWRKETNFTFKRILLLSIPLISIILPLINLNISFQTEEESNAIQYITYIPSQLELVYAPIVAEVETITVWEITFWIFVVGAFIMMVKLITSYYKIWQLYRESVPDASGHFRLIEDPFQSFSFFNLVLINRSQAMSRERDYIISHEKAHSRQGHSFDVVWMELIKMLHWFNPVIWLITRESRQNLEYLADQEVAAKMSNIQNYQYAILQHASHTRHQLLKTQFSKSNLKNRIMMMNQPNNQKIQVWKLYAILPVLAILLMSFSVKIENLDIKKEISEVLPSFEPIETIDEKIYEFTKPKEFESQNPFNKIKNRVDSNDAQDGILLKSFDSNSYLENRPQTNTVYNSQLFNSSNILSGEKLHKLSLSISLKDKENTNRVIKNEANKAISNDNSFDAITTDSIPMEIYHTADKPPEPVDGMANFYKVIDYNLRYPEKAKSKGINGKVYVEFVVQKDGSLRNFKTIKGIDAECDAEAIRVVKEGPAWNPGESNGEYVNVRIALPVTFNPEYTPPSPAVFGSVRDENGNPIAGCNIVIEGTTIGTVTDLDGKFHLEMIPSTKAKKIIVSARGFLTESRYAHNGSVHVFCLKKADPVSIRGINVFELEEKPLFIIDGVVMEDFDERTLRPQEIESISVLKDKKAAIEKYGEKGKNGVIIIKSKKYKNDNDPFISNDFQTKVENQIKAPIDQLPEYKEGMEAFYSSIQKTVKYPLEARKNNIQGKVFISFNVTKDGKIENIEASETKFTLLEEIVVVGYHAEGNKEKSGNMDLSILEDEVIRVLKEIDKISPLTKNGAPINAHMTLPVTFKLE